jgi:hypothetical protein
MSAPFSYAAWFQSLKAGRSFATNGPMLFLSADGQEPGSELRGDLPRKVRLRVEAVGPRPIERVEIIADGRVIHRASAPGRDGRWVTEVDHEFTHDGWVAARCFEPAGRTIRFAHTSPVYINLGRRAPAGDDARFFLQWIDREMNFYTTQAGFREPQHREAMLEFFRTAREVYDAIGSAR